MKTFFDEMTNEEREQIIQDFLELHPTFTEECAIGYELNGYSVEFYPLYGNALHHVNEIVKFAEYYNASVYASTNSDGKAILRVC